jgi:hypothetical protein
MKIQDGGQTTRNGLGRPVSSGKGLSIVCRSLTAAAVKKKNTDKQIAKGRLASYQSIQQMSLEKQRRRAGDHPWTTI